MQACKLAIEVGWGMNIGGGFNHDSTNAGGGLAVYDDVGVCLSVSLLCVVIQLSICTIYAAYFRNSNCPAHFSCESGCISGEKCLRMIFKHLNLPTVSMLQIRYFCVL